MQAHIFVEDSAIEIVRAFCHCWDRLDFDAMSALLHDDIRYHNMPLDPIDGKAAVEAYLRGAGPFETCEWELLNIAADGQTVLTERVDRFTVGGVPIVLEVMGVFEIADGRIRLWRDYFDLASYRAQWPR